MKEVVEWIYLELSPTDMARGYTPVPMGGPRWAAHTVREDLGISGAELTGGSGAGSGELGCNHKTVSNLRVTLCRISHQKITEPSSLKGKSTMAIAVTDLRIARWLSPNNAKATCGITRTTSEPSGRATPTQPGSGLVGDR
jgi:hypothetical protein